MYFQNRKCDFKYNKKIMKNKTQVIIIPPTGWKKELAQLANATERTVYNAIRKNSKSEKADKIRALFRSRYINPNT